MSDVNIGLGIGLSGKLDAPARIFAADQQEEAYNRRLKQQADKEEEAAVGAVKRMVLQDRDKYHKLLTNDVNNKTTKALIDMANAKAKNPTDYLGEVYTIYGDLKKELDIARTRTEQLKQFEKLVEEEKKGMFISQTQKKAYELMKSSDNYENWVDRLKTNGVSDNYFSFDPETKDIGFKFQPAYDPQKFAEDVYKTKRDMPLYENEENFTIGGQKGKKITTAYGLPRTQAEAEKIREDEIRKRGGSAVGVSPAYSGESVAELYLSDPERLEQYQNRFKETQNMSAEELKKHFLNNFYDPYSPFKEEPRYLKESKGQMIFVSGPPIPGRAFTYQKTEDFVPNTNIKYKGLSYLNINVDSKSPSTFLLSGAVLPSGETYDYANKNAKTTSYKFGNVYTVKTVTKGGQKRLVSDDYKAQTGEVVAFEPMIEISFADLEIGDKKIDELTKKTILMPAKKLEPILDTQKMSKEERGEFKNVLQEIYKHNAELSRSGAKVK